MLAIPAIDIYEGKVVRLLKGDFNQIKIYSSNPVETAKSFSQNSFPWIHIVDLAASVDGKISIQKILGEIKNKTKLKIQFGGGIKTYESAKNILENGIDRIIIGTMSITNKKDFEKTIDEFGSEKITAAIDVQNEIVLIKGWTQKSQTSLWDHIDYCLSKGIKHFLCTDISKDGTLEGPGIEFYKKILNKYPQINLIASGGIGSVNDLIELEKIDMHACVVGKAIYENKITLEELKKFAG